MASWTYPKVYMYIGDDPRLHGKRGVVQVSRDDPNVCLFTPLGSLAQHRVPAYDVVPEDDVIDARTPAERRRAYLRITAVALMLRRRQLRSTRKAQAHVE